MIWLLLLGVCITLGGFCLCCGCVYCTDGTSDATMQIDLAGIVEDADNGSGCCTDMNTTYILDMDPNNPCRFTKTQLHSDCSTDDCEQCDSAGCTPTCNELPNTHACPPNDPTNCDHSANVLYSGECNNCEITEGGNISLPSGALTPSGCDCLCVISGSIWDLDVMIIDHPEAADFAVPGEFVWWCTCTEKDCTAGVGKSTAGLSAELRASTPGPGVDIVVNGNMTGGTFETITQVTTDPDTECGTTISALDLSAALTTTPCSQTFCLCTLPTTVTATYLP